MVWRRLLAQPGYTLAHTLTGGFEVDARYALFRLPGNRPPGFAFGRGASARTRRA